MTLPYSEGTVFLVPLRNGGYARGVVARASSGGKGLFGYFFGPRLVAAENAEITGLDPTNALLRVRFGDLGLISGEWMVLGQLCNWDRSKWPMPDFVRRDPLRKRAWLVRYSDNNPMCVESEHPTDFDSDLGTDSGYGYGAVETELTRLIG